VCKNVMCSKSSGFNRLSRKFPPFFFDCLDFLFYNEVFMNLVPFESPDPGDYFSI
jgi:hypothetical protein